MWILLTIAAAACGGLLLMKLKVPGGMLVGAIVGAVVLNLLSGEAYIYPQARTLAQILTGAYIGGTVSKEDIKRLPGVIGPFLVVMASFLCLNLLVAAFFYFTTDMDLLTCLFCAAPGGIGDTPLVAMDMGADGAMVSVMQFVRMIFGMGCLPTIIMLTDRRIAPEQAEIFDAQGGHNGPGGQQGQRSLVKFIPSFLVAMCAGLLGKWLNVPGGILSFSVVAVVVMKLVAQSHPMPIWLRRVAQVMAGCCIGAGITRDQIFQIRQLVIPAIVLCVGYIVCCIGMGCVSSRVFHIELREAMLCLSPAGATEMALIAADLGVHSANLVVLQMCRLLSVMAFFPQIFTILIWRFGA